METIIRSPKGSARRTVKVSDIVIPDLWHVAEHLDNIARKNGLDTIPGKAFSKAAEDVRETWQLAHDLLNNIATDGHL